MQDGQNEALHITTANTGRLITVGNTKRGKEAAQMKWYERADGEIYSWRKGTDGKRKMIYLKRFLHPTCPRKKVIRIKDPKNKFNFMRGNVQFSSRSVVAKAALKAKPPKFKWHEIYGYEKQLREKGTAPLAEAVPCPDPLTKG